MQRIFAIISTVLLLFTQNVPIISGATASAEPAQQFDVKTTEDSTTEKTTIELKSLSSELFDEVSIFLPEESTYNKKMTEELEQKKVEITYEKKDHSLAIKWDEEVSQEIDFVLTDLTHTENHMSVQGVVADEPVVEEKHEINVRDLAAEEAAEKAAEEKAEADKAAKEKAEADKVAKEKAEADKAAAEKAEADKAAAEKAEADKAAAEKAEADKAAAEKAEADKAAKEKAKAEEEKSESDKETKKDSNKKEQSKKKTLSDEDEKLGDLNTYIGIGPVFETALSGADADFRLTMKLTGSKRVYKNLDVVIDLPLTEHITFDDSQENLDHLAIDGVSPTFNGETNELTYHFDEIKRGQMYEKIISLNTENGYIPNDTEVVVNASINGEVHYTENDEKEEAQKGDVVPFDYTDKGSMNITASGALSLSKYRVDESEKEYAKSSIVNRGDEVLWKLELEIPKKTRGQLFLNPDEKIVITDTLPAELEYVEVISGDQPKSLGNGTITWEFDADDFKTQNEKGKNLFTKEIVISTKVKSNASKGEKTNNAEASATFIEDIINSDDASRSVLVALDNPGSGNIKGTTTVPNHFGPGGTSDIKNPRPTVTDDEILRFSHNISPLLESFPDRGNYPSGELGEAKNFRQLDYIYDVDKHLNLESMRAPGPFQFKPNNQYPAGEFFKEQPNYAIKASFDDGKTFETLVSAEEVIPGKVYTAEELGLQPGQKINIIKIEFQKNYQGNKNDVAPGGIQTPTTPQYTFSIDKGFTGVVENKMNIIGINGNGKPFDDQKDNKDRYDNSKDTDISGPRQATVVAYGQDAKPVGRVGVKLLEDVRGVVTLGKNTMQIELENINNSGAPMNEQLETVVLLPPGVILHDDVNPSYTNAKGNPTEEASYEVVDQDYNGSGRQLVKVKWNDSRLTKGENLRAELDVVIKDHAPNQLNFDVYGFSNDKGLSAPSNTGSGVTDTVLQNDEEDFYGNGTDQPRLKSGNIYSLAGKYDVQTEKLIKGPNDEGYSKFTISPFDGTVDYKLKMTNTTGKDLSIMTLIDVLPTIGDLGITDNVSRGSTFDPILEGPITLPAEWQGKVNVFYSTTKNPERDDLTRNTDYLPNSPELTNPEGAEAPNWIKESDVSDWNTIHSFKIELQKGDTWIKGQDIEIDFSMTMPSEDAVESNVKNLDLVPQQRAAWNSFAVATDIGQPVEPERVGVALELDPPKTPEVEKEVEGNDGDYGKDLVEKEFEKEYNYQVNTKVPENVQGYEHITLTDTLDDKLDIVGAVALVDGEPTDYEVVIEDQLVTLKVDRAQLDKIEGKKLTLQITAKIKEGTEVAIIDNKAEIQVNDNPSEDSNIVPVLPPPEDPTIEKDIDGEKATEAVEKLRGETYEYNVTSKLPKNVTGYKSATISDELDERLTIEGTKVLVDGEASDLEVVQDGQLITVSLNEDQIKELAGKEIQLVITAKINADVEIEVIDNEASIQVNDNPEINSNIVPVTPPPPETPEIEKEVEGNDGDYGKDLVEKEFEKEYNYQVNTNVPKNVAGYEHITLTDTLDDKLDIVGAVALVDGEPVDYEVVIEDQLVTLKVDRAQLDEIAGQKLTLQITAKIKEGTEVAIIDNKAEIQVNDNPSEDSNKVPVLPPPEDPTIEKDIDGEKATEAVEKLRGEAYEYNVTSKLPKNVTGYKSATISDELDERLTIEGTKVLVDGEVSDLEVTQDGQLVTVSLNEDQIKELAGKEIQLVITAKINADVEIEVIDNEASIQVNDNPTIDSNIVPVTPPPPETPEIEKEVEGNDGEYGKDLVEKEFEKDYNYQVNTNVPENVAGYEHITLTDTLDDKLDIVGAVALVDGEPVDYEVVIEDQLVTLKVDRAQLDEIVGQKLTLQITAKIKEGTEVQIIDNKAEIQVNDNPSEDSNTVPVNPPPEEPTIEKDIDGDKAEEAVIKLRGQKYDYNVTSTLPENVTGYKTVTISDELDERLTIEETNVLVDGKASDLEVVTKGQLVTLSLNEAQIKELAGKEIQLVITATINADTEIEVIDNQANIQVNDNPTIDSNIVPVIPPTTPNIEKDVEGTDHIGIDFDKEYNYNIVTALPTNIMDYEKFIITDKVDKGLVVNADNVKATVDGEVYDGLTVTVNGNDVIVEVIDFTGLEGKEQIELVIPAKIHPNTNMDDYTDNKIPNTVDLDFTNESDEESKITTKPVTVTPPPTPDVEKEVEGNDGEFGKELVEKEREKEYKYNVKTVIPEDLTGYTDLTLADDLDKRLDVKGAIALVDGKEVDYEVVIKDQLVTLKVERAQLDEIVGKELTLQITAQINADVEVEVIDNQATIQVNDNPSKDSNIVPVTPPPPETPEVEKEVEGNDGDYGKDLVEKEFEKNYNYQINTNVPKNVAGYEHITLTDTLDDKLDIVDAVALVDGKAVDYEVVIKDQLVTLKVDRVQLDEIVGQKLTLQITAQIKKGTSIEIIDNKAEIQVNNNPSKDSNIVPVTPPPETPKIDKDVEGKEHHNVDYDKDYKYNVITQLPSNIEEYEKFVVTDKVDKGLVVNADKVTATVDGKTFDGLKLVVDGNDVRVEVTDFAGLKGKGQIELIITAKIHPDTDMNDYKDNKIPNTANLEFVNESGEQGELETKPVTVTPPTPEDPPVDPPAEDPTDPDPKDPVDPKPEDPTKPNPKDPVQPESPTVSDPKDPVQTGDPTELDSKDSGDKLPKTATQMYTLILIGVVLLLIGTILFVARKRAQQ